MKKHIGFFLVIFLLTGCAGLSSFRSEGRQAGFERTSVKTKHFTLTAYSRFRERDEPVTVYIEGDGNAWASRGRLSDDPTPKNPLMLELAVNDPSANVVYLARPGQYLESGKPDCEPAYWAGKRFSDEVIDSMSEAISRLVAPERNGTAQINLIGYSGGAAVAVLIASKRGDIASLRTIAGNLDPEALNQYHHVSPLAGSRDPAEVAALIKDLPQRHFIGSKDEVIPAFIARSFVERLGGKGDKCVTIVFGATHSKGWQERWNDLLILPVTACR